MNPEQFNEHGASNHYDSLRERLNGVVKDIQDGIGYSLAGEQLVSAVLRLINRGRKKYYLVADIATKAQEMITSIKILESL